MKKQKSSLGECTSIFINLIKTLMGTGIMVYPYLFRSYGIGNTLILMTLTAAASVSALWLYIDLNDYYGLDNTMSSLALYIYPPLKLIVDITVAGKCYLVCIAYLVHLKENVPELITAVFNIKEVNDKFIITCIVLLVSPAVFMFKLDKLKYTSSFGLAASFGLVFSSLYYFRNSGKTPDMELNENDKISFLDAIGKLVFGFTCHQNIFAAQNEMKSNNKLALKITVLLVHLSAMAFYASFGIFNYLTFGKNTEQYVIALWPKGSLKNLISVFYFMIVMASIPLQTNPCRSYLLNMIDSKYVFEEKYNKQRFIASFCIITSALIISFYTKGFTEFCNFIGGTFSTMMNFMYAGVYFLMAFKNKGMGIRKVLSGYIIIYGCVALISVVKKYIPV